MILFNLYMCGNMWIKILKVRYINHFDNCFYPYPLQEDFPDTALFAFYNRGFFPEDKADWRRENPEFIHKILDKDVSKFRFERINQKRKKYEVRISVLDRLNNESWLSAPEIIRL